MGNREAHVIQWRARDQHGLRLSVRIRIRCSSPAGRPSRFSFLRSTMMMRLAAVTLEKA